jgi:hypothetical protein
MVLGKRLRSAAKSKVSPKKGRKGLKLGRQMKKEESSSESSEEQVVTRDQLANSLFGDELPTGQQPVPLKQESAGSSVVKAERKVKAEADDAMFGFGQFAGDAGSVASEHGQDGDDKDDASSEVEGITKIIKVCCCCEDTSED